MCNDVLESSPTGCRLLLPHRPSALFRKKGECWLAAAPPVGISVQIIFFLQNIKLSVLTVEMGSHSETRQVDCRE